MPKRSRGVLSHLRLFVARVGDMTVGQHATYSERCDALDSAAAADLVNEAAEDGRSASGSGAQLLIVVGKQPTAARIAAAVGVTQSALRAALDAGAARLVLQTWLQACLGSDSCVDVEDAAYSVRLVEGEATGGGSSSGSGVASAAGLAGSVAGAGTFALPAGASMGRSAGGVAAGAAASSSSASSSSSSASSSSSSASSSSSSSAPSSSSSSAGPIAAFARAGGPSSSAGPFAAFAGAGGPSSLRSLSWWADFPVAGLQGDGAGLVPTPAPYLPLPTRPSLAWAPRTWYDTSATSALGTPFLTLAGRCRAAERGSAAESGSAAEGGSAAESGSAAEGGSARARSDAAVIILDGSQGEEPGQPSSSSSAVQPAPAPALGASGLERCLAQRREAMASASPCSLGRASWAVFPPTAALRAAPSTALPRAPPYGPRAVAAFDIDGTLIRPSAPAAKFCAGAHDWVPAFPGAMEVRGGSGAHTHTAPTLSRAPGILCVCSRAPVMLGVLPRPPVMLCLVLGACPLVTCHGRLCCCDLSWAPLLPCLVSGAFAAVSCLGRLCCCVLSLVPLLLCLVSAACPAAIACSVTMRRGLAASTCLSPGDVSLHERSRLPLTRRCQPS